MRTSSRGYDHEGQQQRIKVKPRPCVVAILGALAMTTIMAGPAIGGEAQGSAKSKDPVAQPQQTTAAQSEASTPSIPGQATESQPKSLEAVVVTGSLIQSPNQVSGSPIVTVRMDQLKEGVASTSLTEILNKLPQISATSGRFLGQRQYGGEQVINLRGLGANRNLVLLDGRRIMPADVMGDVNIALIPKVVIGKTDIITGGASAVYGSDAISGVVNFHTIPYFTGIKADIQYGNSFKGDFFQQSASVVLGSAFGDGKGHVMLAAGYSNNQSLSGSSRDFFRFQIPSSYIAQGTFVPSPSNLPNPAVVNAIFQGYGVSTPVPNTIKLGFNDDGTLFTELGAKNYKGPRSGGWAIINGNVRMPVGAQVSLGAPLNVKQTFSKFEYNFSDHMKVYGQLLAARSNQNGAGSRSLTQFVVPTIPVTNPFIPSDLKAILASRPDPNAPFTWNARYIQGPIPSTSTTYQLSQYLLGIRGDLSATWTYNVYVSHGTTDRNDEGYYRFLASRVQALLDAPDGGASICSGGLNPFGLSNALQTSDACLQYMSTTTHAHTSISQNVVQAVVQGSIFSLPAGAVRLAIEGDVRRNSYSSTPDAIRQSGDIEAVVATTAVSGATKVKEIAAELQVPLLSDLPLVRKLTADGAFRHSDYQVTGGVNTYEGDLKWRPVEGLLIRGGYQRAIRAPNIGELFSAAQGVQVAIGTPPASVGDPCDVRSPARQGPNAAKVVGLCEAQGLPAAAVGTYVFPTTSVAGLQRGNVTLQPEKATTWNYGLTWSSTSESDVLSTMTVSADYWNIQVKNVISVVPGLTSIDKCFNLDGSNPTYAPTNEFCSLLHRDPSGDMDLVETPYENLGSLETSGIDLHLDWAPSMSSLGFPVGGSMLLSSYLSYMHSYKVQTLPGGPKQDYVNTISGTEVHPRWKALTALAYTNGSYTVGVRWNYMGSMDDVTSVTNPGNPSHGTPSYSTYDLFGTYFINGSWKIRAGITDVTDKKAISVATAQFGTNPAVFDMIGRSYYVGLNLSL